MMRPILVRGLWDAYASGGLPALPDARMVAAELHSGDAVLLREAAPPIAAHATEYAVTAELIAPVDTITSDHALLAYVPFPASMSRCVPARRRTFLAGRYCALTALRRGGFPGGPLPGDPELGPRWPPGVAGTITHTTHLAGAIVGPALTVGSIGMDSELPMDAAMAERLASDIAPEWRARLQSIDGIDARALELTALFSAKEALYKCVRPHVDEFFDFTDAHAVYCDLARGEARLRLTRTLGAGAPAGLEFAVALTVRYGHVHACVRWPSRPR